MSRRFDLISEFGGLTIDFLVLYTHQALERRNRETGIEPCLASQKYVSFKHIVYQVLGMIQFTVPVCSSTRYAKHGGSLAAALCPQSTCDKDP